MAVTAIWSTRGTASLARRIAVGIVFITAALLFATATSAEAVRNEYGVKAAFLLNFARLVEWPSEAFSGPRAPLTVGLLGSGKSVESLTKFLDGKPAGSRKVAAREISSASEAAEFHMIFVSSSEENAAAEVASATRGNAVLLVGEASGFVSSGGAIGFFNEDDEVRFEINPKATEAAGLRVSSRLLRVAKIVNAGGSQ